MPALTYPQASATLTAASPMARRTSSGKFGAGLSSTSFWWRRWAEQSRSPSHSVVAVGVGDDLHLDVARPGQVALDVALVPAEVGQRLPHGRLEGLGGLVGAARPPSCPARRRRRRP